MLFVRTRIFGIREIWYAMVLVRNKIAERSYEDFFVRIFLQTFFEFGRTKFLFVFFHEYSVLFFEEKFYSCEDFFI